MFFLGLTHKHKTRLERLALDEHSSLVQTFVQGILKGKVSPYRWPPVWLFGINCMTTDNICFYLQNRLIQTSQTGGQWYSDTPPFSIPWFVNSGRKKFCIVDTRTDTDPWPDHFPAGTSWGRTSPPRPPGTSLIKLFLHRLQTGLIG